MKVFAFLVSIYCASALDVNLWRYLLFQYCELSNASLINRALMKLRSICDWLRLGHPLNCAALFSAHLCLIFFPCNI